MDFFETESHLTAYFNPREIGKFGLPPVITIELGNRLKNFEAGFYYPGIDQATHYFTAQLRKQSESGYNRPEHLERMLSLEQNAVAFCEQAALARLAIMGKDDLN